MTNASSYKGLTWDHPRGYVALERAAAQAADGLTLQWERQPLEGFESHPIEELAEQYDIIVLDHPHVGDAVQSACLQPLDEVFSEQELAQWSAQSIGRSFESYRYQDRVWALPLDAATQVAAAHAAISREQIPRTWADVKAFATHSPVCLSLSGPHAVLSLFSICSAFGAPPEPAEGPELFVNKAAHQAWEALSEIFALSFKGWLDKNPIAILEGLATGDSVAYCPLVFGYVNYSAPVGAGRKPVCFVDVPGGPLGVLGSTLGGTGIGISKRCVVDERLRAHLRDLMSLKTQTEFIPFADGQPSARQAWADAAVNQRWNQFFAGTSATLEAAILRPRFPGYVNFQTEASRIVRNGLTQQSSASAVLAQLQSAYAAQLQAIHLN